MPTAAISGHGGVITGAAGATEITEFSASLTAEALEATSVDSAQWRQFISGLTGGTGSFSGVGVQPTPNGVATVSLSLTFGDSGAVISGTAIITNVNSTNPVDGVVTHSGDFTFTGAISIA